MTDHPAIQVVFGGVDIHSLTHHTAQVAPLETCDNYTAAEFEPALTGQFTDVQAPQADAEQRRWTGEEQRHRHVAEAIENHFHRIRPR